MSESIDKGKNPKIYAITQPQCLVSDATAMVLYVSRAAGIAPLRFRRHRDGWLISVSPSAFVYSIILTLIIGSLYLCIAKFQSLFGTIRFKNLYCLVATGIGGVVLDFSVDPSRSLRVRTPTKRILWIADFSVVMLTMLVAAFARNIKKEKAYCLGVDVDGNFCLTSRCRVLHICQPGETLSERFYMGAYFALILLEMQFIFGVIMVYTAVEALNEPLTNLLEIADCKQNCITIIQKPKRHCETVRHLAVSYIKLCLVVREANRCHAITVLMMFCSNLTHLVITPYYLLLTLFSARNHPGMVLLELAWCLAHIISLLMLVEPCHWTQDEIMGTLTTYLVILLQFQSIDEKKDGLI
ncbi:uncharacterized protein LOC113522716 [Galleria mellonella]|uniref:Gustatory receptor n=1 Tax=Galleria mellonella TaxID=7137 RepID=A0ABM3MKZ2_GALME|nr:uncharacterized protein LOC113522716 [Galleria mellonella]